MRETNTPTSLLESKAILSFNLTPHDGDADDPIILSLKEKQRLYSLWKFSVNIKALGKKLHHQYLKRLIDLWKLKESFPLIDLGLDYYIVKLSGIELQKRILQEGPWFVSVLTSQSNYGNPTSSPRNPR